MDVKNPSDDCGNGAYIDMNAVGSNSSNLHSDSDINEVLEAKNSSYTGNTTSHQCIGCNFHFVVTDESRMIDASHKCDECVKKCQDHDEAEKVQTASDPVHKKDAGTIFEENIEKDVTTKYKVVSLSGEVSSYTFYRSIGLFSPHFEESMKERNNRADDKFYAGVAGSAPHMKLKGLDSKLLSKVWYGPFGIFFKHDDDVDDSDALIVAGFCRQRDQRVVALFLEFDHSKEEWLVKKPRSSILQELSSSLPIRKVDHNFPIKMKVGIVVSYEDIERALCKHFKIKTFKGKSQLLIYISLIYLAKFVLHSVFRSGDGSAKS